MCECVFCFFVVVVVVVVFCVCVWWRDGSIGCSSPHVLLTSTQIEFYYPDYFNFLILSSGRMQIDNYNDIVPWIKLLRTFVQPHKTTIERGYATNSFVSISQ